MEGIETKALSSVQLKAVQDDLGITAEKERAEEVENEILSYIPNGTSSTNQLADKDFVNSSISTATSNLRGTFNSFAELENYSGEKTVNDYAFVKGTDEGGTPQFNRYKYNGTAWIYEYTLNNSSFTAEQWSAVNSGITAELVANIPTEAPAVIDDESIATNRAWSASKINDHTSSTANPHGVTKAQVGLGSVMNSAMSARANVTSNLYMPCGIATAIANGAVCTTTNSDPNKVVTIKGFTLYEGAVVRILFKNGNTKANPTLNIIYEDTTKVGAKAIMVIKGGQKDTPPVHSGKWRGASTYTDESWQPNTLLELMYDGTDWIIMGNPEVENYSDANGGYSVKANGFIEQWIFNSSFSSGTLYPSSGQKIELVIKFSNSNYYCDFLTQSVLTGHYDYRGSVFNTGDVTLKANGNWNYRNLMLKGY